MANFFKKYFPVFFIFLITCLFFYKIIFNGLIAFPGDMLVGAYYPWLDYKWGELITSVPIKNPYITDAFSQIFLWKQLISESYKNFNWPLWNQYSYSGYPLLANYQSGALNIFNLFFVIFGMINGWNIFLFTGIFLSALSMYFYLKIINKSTFSSIIGSIIFSFSGFSILWSQYANANYSLAVIPLIFILIEKYVKTKKVKFLLAISPCLFFLTTCGHLQLLVYGYLISFIYIIYRLKKIDYLVLVPFFFGLLFSLVQVLPTIEMSKLSIRFDEGFIGMNNFGLSPINKLITLFAPDFFGNPSTYNYWGYFNYYETCFYVGILGLVSFIYSLINYKKLKIEKFFIITAIFSLFFGFDTFLGRLFYKLNIPILSTSAAGRISSIFSLSIPVLVAGFLDQIHNIKFKDLLKPFLLIFVTTFIIFITITHLRHNPDLTINLHVAMRNMIFPFFLLFGLFFSLLFYQKSKLFLIPIVFLSIFDLFRFGWKITPFVKKEYVFPPTPPIEIICKDQDLFRIEREYSPILPPNTWIAYKLMSPSGYDPLSDKKYATNYNHILNNNNDNEKGVSRYLELFDFDQNDLGEFNVKYLFVQKNKESKNVYNPKFKEKEWEKIFDTENLSIFKNPKFRPRIEILNQNNQSSINNIFYSANEISFQANSSTNNATLVLRDSWYPGWKAYINGKETSIGKYLDIYRQINIPEGESNIRFIYQPKYFYYGIYIFSLTFITWCIIIIKFRNKKRL